MPAPNPLGDHLRARRELVSPASVGLVTTGARRTPGLRREEVATLAGISADYYLRLEQGRDRNPSTQVLDAIARALQLDRTATAYLHSLIGAEATTVADPRDEQVASGILMLLTSIELPAFVENRSFDVLAANPRARALSSGMRVGVNRLRAFVLDERERELWVDWEASLQGLVAGFRTSLGAAVAAPRVTALVDELSLASPAFRRAWTRHDVRALTGATSRLRHPTVGELELRREKLPLSDSGGQILAVYHAEPGSASARRLASLGELADALVG